MRYKYKEALNALEDGLNEQLSTDSELNCRELLMDLLGLILFLRISLVKQFGSDWEEREAEYVEPDEPSCSFCAKARHETDKLLAGHGGYICASCVRECFAFINEPNS
jgi:hypothetical protein